MDLFCESFTLVCCLVEVCIHILLFFLYRKGYVAIVEFGSSVMQLGKRNKVYKAIA